MIVQTKYFGAIECDSTTVIDFPLGVPGFEGLVQFICLEQPEFRPLVYLQSVADPNICFLTLPAQTIDPAYELEIGSEHAVLLGLQQPTAIGTDLLCLAILSAGQENVPTANLLSPVVIHVRARRGLQVVQVTSQHDWRHPLVRDNAEGIACL